MATSTLLQQIQKGTRISQVANQSNGPNVVGFLAETGGMILNGVGQILGALLRTGGLSLVRVWGWIVSGYQAIINFNWNQSDQQLEANIQQRLISLAGYWGGVAGQLFGWLVCGAIPGAVIMKFNPVMGAYVLKQLGEEAADEIASEIALAIEQTARAFISIALMNVYRNVRRWFFSENNVIAQVILGDKYAEVRENYLNGRSKAWTLARGFEEKVEEIQDPASEAFTEEFFENFGDACIEAGFVIAGAADEWIFQQKFAQRSLLGNEAVVEIQPDRENEEEKIILAGPQALLKGQIVQTLTHHQLIENRDVGQIVGIPVPEFQRSEPLTLRLNIEMFSKRFPPYNYGRRANLTRASFTVPNVDRTKLDWERIIAACGGPNGYMWGRFRASCLLDSGRYIRVYAATEGEAEDRVKALLELSYDKIKTLTIAEEKREGARRENPRLYKEPTRVYPAYCTILNRERQWHSDRGNPTTEGNYIDKKYRVELWTPQKPGDFEERIRELLRHSGGED